VPCFMAAAPTSPTSTWLATAVPTGEAAGARRDGASCGHSPPLLTPGSPQEGPGGPTSLQAVLQQRLHIEPCQPVVHEAAPGGPQVGWVQGWGMPRGALGARGKDKRWAY
jgi:hypothetical protein